MQCNVLFLNHIAGGSCILVTSGANVGNMRRI